MIFDKVNLGYSTKNIPIPNKNQYLKEMISNLESFIKRLRWKAFFFDFKNNNKLGPQQMENFGFNTEKTPPQHKDLLSFETDLYQLVRSLKFRKDFDPSQVKLAQGVKNIKYSSRLFEPADKTTNLYKVDVEDYKKLLISNITAKYQKVGNDVTQNIDRKAKAIAQSLKLDKRIEQFSKREAFVTLQDHKPNFPNIPKCRLKTLLSLRLVSSARYSSAK